MSAEPRRRLGRGLDALLGAYPGEPDGATWDGGHSASGRRSVPVSAIDRNPRNPRRDFRPDDLDDLAGSLKQHGVVQPIVVRRAAGTIDERYEIIAGERRWRAAQLAGLHEIPVTILDVSDRQALELAIVENVQRTDLNAVEEARGYEALLKEFGYTQGDLGAAVGKSRVHVTNTLRLLRLPEAVLKLLQDGSLTAGHGRALVGADDPAKLARIAVDKALAVRETEKLAQAPESRPRRARTAPPPANADLKALEKELSDSIGLKVEVRHGLEGRGELRISYRSLEQLDAICRSLRG